MTLVTVADVIDALGGNSAVMQITERRATAVSNWRASNRFPSNTYLTITKALEAKGHTAPPSLWRMVETAS